MLKYAVHRLVESYRTDKGSRQRIVIHLGTLSIPKKVKYIYHIRISGMQEKNHTDIIYKKFGLIYLQVVRLMLHYHK